MTGSLIRATPDRSFTVNGTIGAEEMVDITNKDNKMRMKYFIVPSTCYWMIMISNYGVNCNKDARNKAAKLWNKD
jgi:hypothetical protein